MTSAHIGQRLKTLREYYCYTQKYVSSKINIERPSYSNYELGKRTPPLEVIITLADFYHISLDDLLCNPDFSPRGASPESDYDSLANDESILLNLTVFFRKVNVL